MALGIIRTKRFLELNDKKILVAAIVIYLAIFSFFSFWKYGNFLYNALDLAIYHQVFYNSALGNFFDFSIHPHSYLGDHFEIILLVLLPFYLVSKNPLTLLTLQTVLVALAAWPLYLISRLYLGKILSLIVVLAYFLNPLVQNSNLFEFHLLIFSLPLLFFTLYFYLKKNFLLFILSALFSLLIREDIALIIFMFGFLALFEKREKKWILWPTILGFGYFLIALKLIGLAGQNENYKFLHYYSWLGDTFPEMIKNFFFHPVLVLKKIFTLSNLIFLIGLLFPCGFLSLLKPKYLIPGLLIFMQILLSGFSSALTLEVHYLAPLIPFLFAASIFALTWLLSPEKNNSKFKKIFQKEKNLWIVIILLAILYSSLTLGPVIPVLNKIVKNEKPPLLDQKRELIQEIDKNQTVISSYDFLSQLSGREKLYSLHYVFLDRQQYSTKKYPLPEKIDYLLLDFEDLVNFQIQFEKYSFYQEEYPAGAERLRRLLEEKKLGLVKIYDSLALYKSGEDDILELYKILSSPPSLFRSENIVLNKKIKFLGWELIKPLKNTDYQSVSLAFFWQNLAKIDQNYQLKIILTDEAGNNLFEKIYPLAYGLYPTTEWQLDEIIQTNYYFLFPKADWQEASQLKIVLVEPEGYFTLDGLRSVKPVIREVNTLEEIEIAVPDINSQI